MKICFSQFALSLLDRGVGKLYYGSIRLGNSILVQEVGLTKVEVYKENFCEIKPLKVTSSGRNM